MADENETEVVAEAAAPAEAAEPVAEAETAAEAPAEEPAPSATDQAIDGAEQVAEVIASLTGNPEAIPAIQLGAAVLQSAAGAVQTLMAAYESNDPTVLAATMAKVRHANDVLMGNVAVPE